MTAVPAAAPDADVCPLSTRVDGPKHGWRFDGDDPYIVCSFCSEMRDAISGRVIRRGLGAESAPVAADTLTGGSIVGSPIDHALLAASTWRGSEFLVPGSDEAALVDLADEVLRLRPIEQRAREVVGTAQPVDTKSLAARGRTRVNLARWILGEAT
jgi:hypothetical protein